jgi:hypothetical protein
VYSAQVEAVTHRPSLLAAGVEVENWRRIMRVKLSGSVEVVEALERTAQSAPDISVEGPLTRRENTRLALDLKEVADLIVMAKDFAEVVALCWGGLQVLRGISAKPVAKSGEAATPNAAENKPASIPLEVTTPRGSVRIAVSLESTPEQIAQQLAPLRPERVP